jgi:antirestriction protein ArdC
VNREIYATITNRFIEKLKEGTVPWQKPWLAAQNIISRKPYQGYQCFASRFLRLQIALLVKL